MAESTKSKSDDHDTAPAKSRAADPSRHAASSDPAIHKLLAERQTHEANLEALRAPADPDAVKAAEAAIAEIDAKLAEL